jgi:hypothetical protein
MIKPLWAGVAGVALVGTFGAVAAVVAGTGGEEEVSPAVQATATSAVSATPSPSRSPASTPPPTSSPPATPALTPIGSAQPSPSVPDDWSTYSDPEGRFTVRYPPAWFQHDGAQFTNINPEKAGHSLPPETVEIEVTSQPVAQSSQCGAQSLDPQTGAASPQPGATARTLGGVDGWQITRLPGDPNLNDGTRIDGISVIYKGTCFIVAGYYTQQVPDPEPFRQIASTFSFTY